MSREIRLDPMIDTSYLDNSTNQSLAIMNQTHDMMIGDKLSLSGAFSDQIQSLNKLRNQKLRCYLCEAPKQEYSLIRTFGELVCRGCFNYEGKDRVEQLIENARQFKFAHFIGNNSNKNISRPLSGSLIESDDSSLRTDKLPEVSFNMNYESGVAANKGVREQQQHRRKLSNGREKAQPNEEHSIILDKRRQAELQLASISLSSDKNNSAKARFVSVPTTNSSNNANNNNRQSKIALPNIDNSSSSNNQVEAKQSILASTIQKHNSNQKSVVYKQTKFNPNSANLSEPKPKQKQQQLQQTQSNTLSLSPTHELSNQIGYKTLNEEQELIEDSLSSQIEQIHQHQQSRLHFDPSNLPYPLILPANKNLGTLNVSSSQDQYHSGWFRHPSLALQSPNAINRSTPSQDLRVGMAAGAGKRTRSFLGNQSNGPAIQLNGQAGAFQFGPCSILPPNVLYHGANLQNIYSSSGSIYYSPYQQQQQARQQQFHHYPSSPTSQGSSRGQQKSPSSSSYSTNPLGKYTSIFHPKVILDPRLRSNVSSQEQQESQQQQVLPKYSPRLQLFENNGLQARQQRQLLSNKDCQQKIQEELTSDSPTIGNQINGLVSKPETDSTSLPRLNQTFQGSQSSPQFVGKQSSILVNTNYSPLEAKKTLHNRTLNHKLDSSLVKDLELYQSNLSSSTINGKHKTNLCDSGTEFRELDQRNIEIERKSAEVFDRNSTNQQNYDLSYEKQQELSRVVQEGESLSILRQKLSDKRLNNTASRNNITDETVVIDVEDDSEEPTKKINTTPSTRPDDEPYSFGQSPLRSQQVTNSYPQISINQVSTGSFAIDRLITNRTTSKRSPNPRSVKDICGEGSKSRDNDVLPEDTATNSDNSSNISRPSDSNDKQSSSSNNSSPEAKLNCLICSKNLVDRHFVQCPSVLIHKFCFSCTRNSIRDQRETHKLREGETEKSKYFFSWFI